MKLQTSEAHNATANKWSTLGNCKTNGAHNATANNLCIMCEYKKMKYTVQPQTNEALFEQQKMMNTIHLQTNEINYATVINWRNN